MEARAVAAELEKMYLGYSPDIRLVENIIGYQAAHVLFAQSGATSQSTSAYLQDWLKKRTGKIGARERDGTGFHGKGAGTCFQWDGETLSLHSYLCF